MKKLFFFFAAALSLSLSAQDAAAPKKAPANWFNLSYATSGVHGVRTEQAYDLAKGKKADTIIVAVMDGGVDYMHEDLKNVMWHNRGEIAGNGIDDDKNGYVDDIYGWNFIGNKSGENVEFDNLELVRLLRPLKKKYQGMNESTVPPTQREEFNAYVKLRDEHARQYADAQKTLDQLGSFKTVFDGMKEDIKTQKNIDTVLYKDFKEYNPSEKYKRAHLFLKLLIKSEEDWTQVNLEVTDGYKQYYNMVNYNLNMDYDPRSIVGDNYENADERNYGNPDIKGPDALHGTHVAGIIAADRFNNLGMFGVATPVKIMGIRVVPNGDERDKDVANGIRYAVDNGARIINMSFGKGYSFNKGAVDAAVKYAESKGVLIVHAAGNSNQNNDNNENFPSDHYNGGGTASNWIEVGALSWKDGKDIVAPFSNYGKAEVDVFAPGVDINAPKSNGGYINESGTSMASPVTAGVAAFLLVYYPTLTPAQVKTIIEQSTDKSVAKSKVNRPGGKPRMTKKRTAKKGPKPKKVKFETLSTTGGIVDLYAAMQLAETMKK
ncbi:MAG: S8 family serine peptidase [Bacteroidota bacterium]|nr:S8 family serine peptidase [Bacteroidota bacterium]